MPRVSEAVAVELAPGVTAISSQVSLNEPLSWVEPDARGTDPSNCYLILSNGAAMLIDTGVRAQGEGLLDRLGDLVDPRTPLSITLTRVEPDCLGNLVDVARRFNVVRVCSQSNVIPFDYLGPLSKEFPKAEIVNGLHPGDTVPVDSLRSLAVVEPAVRTLPTLWYFDSDTGTLFCSDFFGEDRPELDGDAPSPDVARVRRHLLAKFDWLQIADTSTAMARLDKVFRTMHVRALAPGHGLWVAGEDAVRERYEVVREALGVVN